MPRWAIGMVVTGGLAAYFALRLASKDRAPFLPGRTTDGHHQIERDCDACHTPFTGAGDRACLACHAAGLAAGNDSHAPAKFDDPRAVALLAVVDASRCVACHREHVPHLTGPAGVTVPADFCYPCHADVARDRPSHRGFDPRGCAAVGCHSYHDNTGLYEEFVAGHLDEPATRDRAVVPRRSFLALYQATATHPVRPLGPAEQDGARDDRHAVVEWAGSAHARAGVNCSHCHVLPAGGAGRTGWTDQPSLEPCRTCHAREHEGFVAGRHGMRLARGLLPMRPGLARLPMRPEAAESALSCNSCHRAHAYDTRAAAVDACLTCHDDAHSRAYLRSPHYRLWQMAQGGAGSDRDGVSCATCHLPRLTVREGERERVLVQHNQNANLRPASKMLRSACLPCHGLRFSIDALADTELARRNYRGAPQVHVQTADMVARRLAAKRR